jgi:hypothetical protein
MDSDNMCVLVSLIHWFKGGQNVPVWVAYVHRDLEGPEKVIYSSKYIGLI